MTFRALTISREYGSGGAEVAAIAANCLGWRLIDKGLLAEISAKANVPEGDVAALDERRDPWLQRISRPIWGKGGDGVSDVLPVELFDADAEADVARTVIEEAYQAGNCVFVGRGSQCLLRHKPDVYRVLVYARWEDRVRRVQARVPPGADVSSLLQSMDARRLEYLRAHYGENGADPHLYDLLIDSRNQTEAAARLIVCAMELMK